MAKFPKEDLIVLIIFATCSLFPPMAIIARHFFEIDPLAWLNLNWGRTVLGYISLLFATLICLFNFYVSIYVPWEYERKHGSMKDFAHMSGLPMLGSICVFCAGALLPSSVYMGTFLLLIYVFDGNGLPYFFFCVIRGDL
jgi:hypothetical protein